MLTRIAILLYLLLNIAAGAYILVEHYDAFHQVMSIVWLLLGLAAATVFAISLLQDVRKGEIPAGTAGDLALRSLLGSLALLLSMGWLLRG